MKKGLIVSGGILEIEFLKDYLKQEDYTYRMAVDGALAKMEELGISPTHIVGDFDTVSPEVLEKYEKDSSIVLERHRPQKDETDTQLAISLMLSAGAQDITIIGALGNRMDHAIANIGLMYLAHQKGIPCRIVDSRNRITLVEKKAVFHKKEMFGKYISFYPLTGTARGLSLTGFLYPLSGRDIFFGSSLCISNELACEEGVLSLEEGILICFETRD